MPKIFFITGADTGAGKTVVTGLLLAAARAAGLRAITHKWVQTGAEDDVRRHERIAADSGYAAAPARCRRVSYAFPLPASPHLSAATAGRRVVAGRIIADTRRLALEYQRVLVESSGGVLVPYNNRRYLVDIAGQMRLPAVLVADNKLGVINHALLSIEALRHRGMRVAGMVLTQTQPADAQTLAAVRDNNPLIIARLSGVKVVVLPYAAAVETLYPLLLSQVDRIAGW